MRAKVALKLMKLAMNIAGRIDTRPDVTYGFRVSHHVPNGWTDTSYTPRGWTGIVK